MYIFILFIHILHICRWSVKDKALALSLFHSSPKTYRMLQKVIARICIIFSNLIILHVIYLIIIFTLFIKLFKLPSTSTLHRSMKNIVIYPGFSSHILNALKVYIFIIYLYNLNYLLKYIN